MLILLKIATSFQYIKLKPYKKKRHLIREVIVEILFIFIYIFSLRFTLFESEVFTIKTAATCIIFTNISVLSIEVISAIYESALSLQAIYKSYKLKNQRNTKILPSI